MDSRKDIIPANGFPQVYSSRLMDSRKDIIPANGFPQVYSSRLMDSRREIIPANEFPQVYSSRLMDSRREIVPANEFPQVYNSRQIVPAFILLCKYANITDYILCHLSLYIKQQVPVRRHWPDFFVHDHFQFIHRAAECFHCRHYLFTVKEGTLFSFLHICRCLCHIF